MDFQALSWFAEDTEGDPEGGSEGELQSETPEETFVIYIFGVDASGRTVCVRVSDFRPYFYVKIARDHAMRLVDALRYTRVEWKRAKLQDAYGFKNQKKDHFVKLSFGSARRMRSARWAVEHHMTDKPIRGMRGVTMEVYNGKADPVLLFMHERGLSASGWVRVENSPSRSPFARADVCVDARCLDICAVDKSDIPPLKILSFDIECFSETGAFPDPKRPRDAIVQIGNTTQRFGRSDVEQTVIVLGECDAVKGTKIVECRTERELLRKWVDFLIQENPDVVVGYNIDDFDWTYVHERAQFRKVDLGGLSRLPNFPARYKKDKMESKAYGMNIFNFVDVPGMVQIDLLHWFRKNEKLDSYKLDYVAETFLGERKRDVTPQEIFAMAGPKGTPAERAVVADYCAQDTLLPLKLMENRCIVPNTVEMSRVTFVPIMWLVMRGQQIKVYSQLLRELMKRGMVLPKIEPKGVDGGGYTGASVLDCSVGAHFDPVSGLDFKSLYPSIMIAHNLCPTTWVNDGSYNNLEGISYAKWEDHTFVKNVRGVVPEILERLWKERNAVKRQMKKESDPGRKAVLNGKQLAIKVSMNSIYGFFGVTRGILPCRPIAETVTRIGREMIEHSRTCAEEWYDGSDACGGIRAEVIYGDSVPGHMPVTLKIRAGKFIVTKRIDSVHSSKWNPMLGPGGSRKEWADLSDCMILTGSGWARARKVIRHKVCKRMYRVVTERGVVECTEDHSLIREDGTPVKPGNLVPGETLLHRHFT